jgi:hypothetical protein
MSSGIRTLRSYVLSTGYQWCAVPKIRRRSLGSGLMLMRGQHLAAILYGAVLFDPNVLISAKTRGQCE